MSELAPTMEQPKSGLIERLREKVLATAAVAGSILVFAACGGDKDDKNTNSAAAGSQATEVCEDITGFTTTSKIGEGIKTVAEQSIGDNEETEDYIRGGIFQLDGKVSATSLALMHALTEPTKDKNATEADMWVGTVYNDAVERYKGENGVKEAKEDCVNVQEMLVSSSTYNESYASDDSNVFRFKISKDDELSVSKVNLDKKLDAVDVKQQTEEARSMYNFGIQDGEVYVIGTAQSSSKDKKDTSKGGSSNKNDQKAEGQSIEQQVNGGGSSRSEQQSTDKGTTKKGKGKTGSQGGGGTGEYDGKGGHSTGCTGACDGKTGPKKGPSGDKKGGNDGTTGDKSGDCKTGCGKAPAPKTPVCKTGCGTDNPPAENPPVRPPENPPVRPPEEPPVTEEPPVRPPEEPPVLPPKDSPTRDPNAPR